MKVWYVDNDNNLYVWDSYDKAKTFVMEEIERYHWKIKNIDEVNLNEDKSDGWARFTVLRDGTPFECGIEEFNVTIVCYEVNEKPYI